MTLEVRLRPEAGQDLADAAAWYEDQRQGLGHKTGCHSSLSIQCFFSGREYGDCCRGDNAR